MVSLAEHGWMWPAMWSRRRVALLRYVYVPPETWTDRRPLIFQCLQIHRQLSIHICVQLSRHYEDLDLHRDQHRHGNEINNEDGESWTSLLSRRF